MTAPLIDGEAPIVTQTDSNVNTLTKIPKLDSHTAPNDIILGADTQAQQNTIDYIKEEKQVKEQNLLNAEKISKQTGDAAINLQQVKGENVVKEQEVLAKQIGLNTDNKETVNKQQYDFLQLKNENAQSRYDEREQTLIKEREIGVRDKEKQLKVERARAQIVAHMSGMSFSTAGQNYIANTVESTNTQLEDYKFKFDKARADELNLLQENIDNTNYKFLEITTKNNFALDKLKLEYTTALEKVNSISNLNDADKRVLIAGIDANLIKTKTDIEDYARAKIRILQNTSVKQQKIYADDLDKRKQSELARYRRIISTGGDVNLTKSDLIEISQKTGYSYSDLVAEKDSVANSIFSDAVLKSNKYLSATEISNLKAEYNTYLRNGLSPVSAVALLKGGLTESPEDVFNRGLQQDNDTFNQRLSQGDILFNKKLSQSDIELLKKLEQEGTILKDTITKNRLVSLDQGQLAVVNIKDTEKLNVIKDTTGITIDSKGIKDIINYTIKKKGTKQQCGQTVNSYIEKQTGTYGKMGSTLTSKNAVINSVGKSDIPVVGGLFTKDIGKIKVNGVTKEYGHTGIVHKVYADGSVDVIESNTIPNSKGQYNGSKPNISHYSAAKVKSWNFSKSLSGNTYVEKEDDKDLSFEEKEIIKYREKLKYATEKDKLKYSAQINLLDTKLKARKEELALKNQPLDFSGVKSDKVVIGTDGTSSTTSTGATIENDPVIIK